MKIHYKNETANLFVYLSESVFNYLNSTICPSYYQHPSVEKRDLLPQVSSSSASKLSSIHCRIERWISSLVISGEEYSNSKMMITPELKESRSTAQTSFTKYLLVLEVLYSMWSTYTFYIPSHYKREYFAKFWLISPLPTNHSFSSRFRFRNNSLVE